MNYLDTLDIEKIRREDEEWKKKKDDDYKEIHLRYKKINLKELQKKYTKDYLHESCM
jgi:hypothetical protein